MHKTEINIHLAHHSNVVRFFCRFPHTENEDGESKQIPFLKYSNVFHLSQCERFENSVAYIGSWLRKLKGDNRFVVTAASVVQKAANMILDIAGA